MSNQAVSVQTFESPADRVCRLRDIKEAAERAYKLACGEFLEHTEPGEREQASDGRYVTHRGENTGKEVWDLDESAAIRLLEKAGIKVPRVRVTKGAKVAHVVVQ